MAEPLKNNYDKKYLKKLSSEVSKHHASFDSTSFTRFVFAKDWDQLELKQRTTRIKEALKNHLPDSFIESIQVLKNTAPSFGGYEALYFPEYVATYGRDKKLRSHSLKALVHFTRYSSSEMAVRPFIQEDPKKMMDWMLKLSNSSNHHDRRLASEGCRPRLPWASVLQDFVQDPSPILPILENLKDDPELYVKKSVANNLNDISKDHPYLVTTLLSRWMKGSPSLHTQWIVRHALRTLIKKGEPEALEILGYAENEKLKVSPLRLSASEVDLGGDIEFNFQIHNASAIKQNILVDYIVHHVKKNGSLLPKAFKLKTLSLQPGEKIRIAKKHSLKKINTRTYYSGTHYLQLQINGRKLKKFRFDLNV